MPSAYDPRDLSSLEKAVNESARKAAVLWTSFITVGAYLLIATGSVKHRDLFLDAAIRLPVLGVDLPVAGYFVVAPIIFLILHFYVLLQLGGLSRKVADYNSILNFKFASSVDRQLLRQRLDDFPFLQFLAAAGERRNDVTAILQIAICWITMAIFPVVIFVQLQIAFLPYHSGWITSLQRGCLIGDLGSIWAFWHMFRRKGGGAFRVVMTVLGGAGTLLLLLFSIFLATFPGEAVYRSIASRAVDALVSFMFVNPTTSASRYFFEGDVDGVTGRPTSLFANRIILTGEDFYQEATQQKPGIGVSLRGRDLRGAILSRSDLRHADFTGASLVEASFTGAKLQGARFGCAAKLLIEASGRLRRRERVESCDEERAADLRGADFSEADLQGAFLNQARLQGARFYRAMMQGASLDAADLTAASFAYARLEGTSMSNADCFGASFFAAQMQGANLDGASLRSAALVQTQLQGADLSGADLTDASFLAANLYRSFFALADHRETIFTHVHATPGFPRIRPFRHEHGDEAPPKTLDVAGYKVLVGRALVGVQDDATKAIVVARLKAIDPETAKQEGQIDSASPIKTDPVARARIKLERVEALAESLCAAANAPFIARGFIYNGRILGAYELKGSEAEDPALRMIAALRSGTCAGAIGLDVNDFREVRRIERQILDMKKRAKAKEDESQDTNEDDGDE